MPHAPKRTVSAPDGAPAVHRLPHVSHRFEQGIKRLFGLFVPKRFRRAPSEASAQAQIVPAIPASLLKAEVDALPNEQLLVCSGQFRVHYARAVQIPWCLQEIGRLREISFRAVGEGTGRASDVDLFDAHYLHLFVWDIKAHVIVGAYRMGLVDEILAHHGKQGLYTRSLFKYDMHVLQSMNPAIELGRSFVRSEYQRSYASLMLLWRGIGGFVARNPRYAVLFGAVSISNSYDPVSRQLIVEYLKANTIEADLARHVKSRRRFAHRKALAWDAGEIASLKSIEDLSRLIARIEPDAKGVPVLFRQYLKLGGRLLGFNSDAQFSDTLDGLMKVDLRNSELRVLTRYLGAEGAATFLAYHKAESDFLRRA